MAVAVKNPEAPATGLLDRLRVGILLGVAYVVGCLGLVFQVLPHVWFNVLGMPASAVGYTLLLLVGLALGAGLVYLGARLVGPSAPHGLRAGVFLGLASLLLVMLVTRLFSTWYEQLVYERRALSESTGWILSLVTFAALLGLALWTFFLRPGYQDTLGRLEDQGWFGAFSYKATQGQRVRRGTMLGLLLIVGAGVWALVSHRTLDRMGAQDWTINVPFTSVRTVAGLGDAVKAGLRPEDALQSVLSEQTFRDVNTELTRLFLRIDKPGDSDFAPGQVVTKAEFEKVRADLAAKDLPTPTFRTPDPMTGPAASRTLTLLPHVRYTLPLLLGALGLWLSWRLVNFPAFADFLIATEAELNKVSWTTRKRLIQDTIVVLTTVFLLTVFLFAVDILWGRLLSWKPIGVLKLDTTQQTQGPQQQPW